jgi:DNA-directed RNA polymerase specialized sigma24 family protein
VNGKQAVILKGLVALALVWAVVFAVRSFASSKKVTAERLDREVRELDFADWSENPGSGAEAKRREEEIRRIADMVNRLDFNERQKNRQSRAGETFFRKLSPKEKNLFIDQTIVESMGRFMEALDQMPEEQRKKFVEQGLKEIQEGRTEEEMKRAEEMDSDLLAKISQEGMRAYFDKASADTKLDLAPLMQAMNEVMQGLRGNEFGQRRRDFSE